MSGNYHSISMKKLILLLAASLFGPYLHAQTHLIGLRAGPAMTDARINITGLPKEQRFGFTAGVTYDYFIRERISVGADLMYQPGGFRRYFTLFDASGQAQEERLLIRNNFHYVALPLKVGVHTRTQTKVFVQAAMIPAFLVAANTHIPVGGSNQGQIIPPSKGSVRESLQPFDLAARLELGMSHPFGDRWRAYGSFSAQHSVTSYLVRSSPTQEPGFNNLLSFNLGLQYALGKK
jgi:hypothetical protein